GSTRRILAITAAVSDRTGCAVLARRARLPERLRTAGIRGPSEDEEQVGEAVQVGERKRVHRRDEQRFDLGSAADRPGEGEPRRASRRRGSSRLRRRRGCRCASVSQARPYDAASPLTPGGTSRFPQTPSTGPLRGQELRRPSAAYAPARRGGEPSSRTRAPAC